MNNNANILKEQVKRYRDLLVRSRNIVGAIALELFDESFDKQGQIMGNGRVQKWKNRGFSPTNRKGRAILIKTGRLRRSGQAKAKGATIVEIQYKAPYAAIHNEGGTIQVTAKMRRFFWSQYIKHAGKLIYNIADQGLKQTKSNLKRNEEAEFWLHMAMAKQITIPKRPFVYDTKELPKRIDNYFIKQLNTIFNVQS